MKRFLFPLLLLFALCVRGAVPTFQSFEPTQFLTNNNRIAYIATHTNDAGIIYPALVNSLTLTTNENVYGTFSLPAKVTILSLGTNYLDLSTNSTWLLNSPTNDATQVILSLSAGQYQGQLAFITSQNGANSFTLPDLSEQWDVPGAYVDIQGDWVGTTNRGIILQYTSPDWIEMARFDPAQSGGGTVSGNGTTNYIAMWSSPTQLTNSPLYSGNAYTVTLISTNNNTPSFVLSSPNTNVLGGFFAVYGADSDGVSPIAWLNGVKDNGWSLGTPGARDGTFSITLLHDNLMQQRFEINGSGGNISFFDRTGVVNFTIANVSGYTGAGTLSLSDDGTYKNPSASLYYGGQFGFTSTALTLTNIRSSNLSVGAHDLFTIPAGKRFILQNVQLATTNMTGSTSATLYLKTNGVSYRYSANSTVLTNQPTGLNATGDTFFWEAGEVVVMSNTLAGANAILFGVLFPTNIPAYSPRLLSLSVGNNTIYTCPAGKCAINPLFANDTPPNENFITFYINDSGASRTNSFYVVPSGGSPDSTNIRSTIITPAATIRTHNSIGILFPGDSLVISTEDSAAVQWFRLSVCEIPFP